MTVIGWDIGGVNTKAARVANDAALAARNEPFEIQHAPSTPDSKASPPRSAPMDPRRTPSP